MAVLKKITFGSSTTPIAKTVVSAKAEGVMSVAAPSGVQNGIDENVDYQYELDVNVDGTTIVKSNGSLAVGTVPAAQVSVADSGDKFTATNVEAALAELKGDIAEVVADGKSYSIVDDTANVQDLPQNVLKRYRLQETVGLTDTLVGTPIDILKDNSLLAAKLSTTDATWNGSAIVDGKGDEALVLVYKDANGTAQVIAIDVSAFLKESEFGDGLAVSNTGAVSAKLGQGLEFGGESGENQSIKVKIDSTSSGAENFLSVGANGLKISGVQDAIDASIADLDVTDTAVAGQYVSAVSETDGEVSVSRVDVSAAPLNNYAKGTDATAVAATDTINQAISKLENQVANANSAITTAIQNLDSTDTAAAGQVVTAVSTADGIASPTKANLAGITLGGFTQDTTATGAIADTDTLGAALNKLENAIDAAADAAEAAHSVVAEDSGNTHVTVTASQPDATTGAITYTIGETNIADADDLADEITRAQNAEGAIDTAVGLTKASGSETRSFTPTTNYGGNSATVMANMQALDTQIKANADAIGAIQYKVNGTELTFYGMREHA